MVVVVAVSKRFVCFWIAESPGKRNTRQTTTPTIGARREKGNTKPKDKN